MTAEDYLDAIRLVAAAPTNSRRMVSVIEDILYGAPQGPGGHAPVHILTASITKVMRIAQNTNRSGDTPS